MAKAQHISVVHLNVDLRLQEKLGIRHDTICLGSVMELGRGLQFQQAALLPCACGCLLLLLHPAQRSSCQGPTFLAPGMSARTTYSFSRCRGMEIAGMPGEPSRRWR